MLSVTKKIFMFCICAVICFGSASASFAREVITINDAKGGQYSILAYNTSSKSYYQLNGALSSNSHKVEVPRGYASSLTVAKGRAVGTRNLYEKNDPVNPIYKVVNKTQFVLDIQRTGTGASSYSTNSVGDVLTNGLNQGFKRQPPQ